MTEASPIEFLCEKCGASQTGTVKDIEVALKGEGAKYWLEWNSIDCDCGSIMLPVASDRVLNVISRRIVADRTSRYHSEIIARATPQVIHLFPWKPMITGKKVIDTYLNAELPNGMRLEFWPAKDEYRYKPSRKRGVKGGPTSKGGLAFILELRKELDNGAGR